jgi:hypothetical protein
MTKWELECADSLAEAKKLASEGWELVSVIQGGDFTKFYFKRPEEKKK